MTEFSYIQQPNLGIEQILALISNQKKEFERLSRTQYIRRLLFAPHEINYSMSGNFRLDSARDVRPDPVAPTIPTIPDTPDTTWTTESFSTDTLNPTGAIFTHNNHFYILSVGATAKAYTSQGIRDSSQDISFQTGRSYHGASATSSHIFLLYTIGFSYYLGRFNFDGTQEAGFRLTTGPSRYLGLVTVDNYVYVVVNISSSSRNSAIQRISNNFGNRSPGITKIADITEKINVASITGLTFARNKFFVSNQNQDVLQCYSFTGTYQPQFNINLSYIEPDGNGATPIGLTFAGNHIYVLDNDSEKVYPIRV